jgi:alpha-glucoside transport system substrate-binding protein
MPIFDRGNRQDLDQLVEEYTTTSNINRRQFLQRATAAGLSISAASALLAACGGGGTSTSSTATSVDVLAVWSGVELTNFNLINTAFTKKTGIKVNVETTRDAATVLNTRIRGNNPPDVTGSPGLSQFRTLITQGKVIRLDSILDMNQIRSNFSQDWINLASLNGGLYGVLMLANSKGTVWYDPKQFTANGYTVPQTWNDLITLSDKIASAGQYPWTLGVESGAASGWPGADWIDQIFLSLNGGAMTDAWVAHKIPWTDASVKNAFQMFGQIVQGKHYINGAPQAILATNFTPASYLPYDSPPKAYMDYLGDFLVGFITAQFPSLQAGTDYNFFTFPTITPAYAGAVTGGADMVFALRDNSAIRQYLQYLSTAEAQEIWVKQGGKSSVNKAVPLSAYPNDVQRAAGKQLSQAPIFRNSPDDLMPQAMETAYWKGVLDYISNPSQLNSILSTLESTAVSAYSS